jgi:hypothetical protein
MAQRLIYTEVPPAGVKALGDPGDPFCGRVNALRAA